jgi:uncharacterized protein
MESKQTIEMNNKEIWFANLGKNIINNRWKYLSLIVVVVVIASLGLPKIKLDTSIENWFPKKSKEFISKQNFEQYFGNDDIIGIHLKTNDVFEPEIIEMLKELGNDLETEVPFTDEVTSITNLEYTYSDSADIITVDLVPESPDLEDLKIAKDRILDKPYLKNHIVSKDFTETWIVLHLLPYPDSIAAAGKTAPENMVGEKVLEILKRNKYNKYNLRAVGTPVYSFEELKFAGSESAKLLGLTILVLIIFLTLFYRSFKGVAIPIASAIVSIIIVFGIMGYLGIRINAILFAVPVIFSLSISLGYSVHLINYYRRELQKSGDVKKSVIGAVAKSGWPTIFAALTTIAALLSFVSIGLIPLKWLGLTSASLVVVIFLIVFVLTASLLSFSKIKETKATKHRSNKLDKLLYSIVPLINRRRNSILYFAVLLIIVMAIGLSFFEVNFDTERSYGMKVTYIKRMLDVAKTEIGSFDSYNISIEFSEPQKCKKIDVLNKFDQFEKKVSGFELTKKTNSILTILKDMNRIMNDNSLESYRLPENSEQVAQLLMIYEMAGGSKLYDWVNSDFNVLRLKVETNNMNARQTVSEIDSLRNLTKEFFPTAKFNITGGMPRLASINHLVSIGQIKSLFIALVLISIMMWIVFGNIKLGLIGLIPNLLPIIVVGGTMGLLGIPIDFLTVTIAPMILGIAVDDTIHIFNHAKNEYEKTGDYESSVTNTIGYLGKASIVTSVIIMLSFSIYLTSSLNMMKYLGMFVVLGIGTALLSDIIITPLLIVWLKPFKKK